LESFKYCRMGWIALGMNAEPNCLSCCNLTKKYYAIQREWALFDTVKLNRLSKIFFLKATAFVVLMLLVSMVPTIISNEELT
jgi:type IV secretory pathway component VirB8